MFFFGFVFVFLEYQGQIINSINSDFRKGVRRVNGKFCIRAMPCGRERFRIVRFKISEDSYETVLTNLEIDQYPPQKLKELYAARWGIETSFRDLKYTTGMLDFHSKKVMCIQQEIYAHLIMYNFAEMITSHVVIDKKQRKHTYKANFSVALHMCRLFYQGNTSPLDLETIISRNLVPVRPGRHRERKLTNKIFHGFLYRVA